MFSQEMSAIANIRAIHTAQQEYRSLYGKYATSLAERGPPVTVAGAGAADLIDITLAGGEKGGYRFVLSP
jgi:hypothetical protein